MIHTLTITHQVMSPKVFNEIYKRLETITGKKPKKIASGECKVEDLREIGLSHIVLTSKQRDVKYRHNFMQITIRLNPLKLIGRNKLKRYKKYIEVYQDWSIGQ